METTKSVAPFAPPFAIDVHSHVEFPGSKELVKKRYADEQIFATCIAPTAGPRSVQVNRDLEPGLRAPLRDARKKIEDMKQAKIDRSVLSIAPFSFYYELDQDLAVEVAQYHNDRMSEMVKANEDYFAGMATLPLQNPKACVKELERAVTKLGLKGIEIGSNIAQRDLGDRDFWPLYEALEKGSVPVFIHPHMVAGSDRLQDYYLTNLIGNPLDTTIAAAQLILSGVLERFPGLKIILAHAGGHFPYIFGRIDHGYRVRPECRDNVRKAPRDFLKFFYFDTIAHSPEALRYLISLVGSDRVVLGSDYPYDMGDAEPPKTVLTLSGITDEDRRKILGENVKSLFGFKN